MKPPAGESSFENLIKMFIEALSYEKGFAGHTIRAYRHDIKEFFHYVKSQAGEENAILFPGDIDRRMIRNFLGMLHQKNEKATIARKISAIRSFYVYLIQKGVLEHNPMERIQTPKQSKTVPAYLSVDDAFRLLDSIFSKSLLDLRNRAMFETLYSTGIRVSELVGMDLADVDKGQGMIRVSGKGDKDRIVPIGRKALDALLDYIEASQHQRGETAPLFLNKNGGRLTARSVGRILQKIIQQCGLAVSVSPHGLRHTFASHMLDSGADLRSLQEFLGHRQLSTTQKYTHVSIDQLMKAYDKAHPRK